MELKDINEILRDSQCIKTLTTTDEDGNPHTVLKSSLILWENKFLAYGELLDGSHTYRNMLRNYWGRKLVSIFLYHPSREICCQIKGRPYKFVYDGPLWDHILDSLWKWNPEAELSGVWMIKPLEIIAQDYDSRKKEEEKRVINQELWRRLRGLRS